METTERPVIPLDGPLAPPRRNGEIVFDAPWESRAFGIAAVLREEGRWTWDDFAAQFGDHSAGPDSYYERWLATLEALLVERGVLTVEEIDERAEEFAQGLFDHH